jgi:lipoyl-dependent peroxiredoxin
VAPSAARTPGGRGFEKGTGINSEELIAGAQTGCFSMALAAALQQAGHLAESIDAHAAVRLEKQDKGFAITSIRLATRARVSGIDDSEFHRVAADAERNRPVSKALAGVKSWSSKLVRLGSPPRTSFGHQRISNRVVRWRER